MTDTVAPSLPTRDSVVTRPLVVIPTYNESENLEVVVGRLFAACPSVHVLIVDDNSPDGTGRIADELAGRHLGQLHVMHRRVKDGLGAAYVAGFGFGIDNGYDVVVEMDADGSHAPEQLSLLFDAIGNGADVAIGSRYVPGGEVKNWPKRRWLLSRTANLYSRLMLGAKVRDITAGYRAYRVDVLTALALESVDSKGYCFQIDLTWRAIRLGSTIVEVPITFVERERGSSKMDRATVVEALTSIARWGFRHRVDRMRGIVRRPSAVSTEVNLA